MKKFVMIAAILLGTTALAQARNMHNGGNNQPTTVTNSGFAGGSNAGASGTSTGVSGSGAVSAFGGLAFSATGGVNGQSSSADAGNKTNGNKSQSYADQATSGYNSNKSVAGSLGNGIAGGATLQGQTGVSAGTAGGFFWSKTGQH